MHKVEKEYLNISNNVEKYLNNRFLVLYLTPFIIGY